MLDKATKQIHQVILKTYPKPHQNWTGKVESHHQMKKVVNKSAVQHHQCTNPDNRRIWRRLKLATIQYK